ncbi:hypothetical protein L204_103674 [Cryptococcus depauperatus]
MNPTQPRSWANHFWSSPNIHYSFSHRVRWPAANAAEGAAKGAADSFLHHGFGANGTPRGPFRGYHSYEGRHGGRWGYRRRPFFGRFAWFVIGMGVATLWHHRHEKRRHSLERFITDPQCWLSMHQQAIMSPDSEQTSQLSDSNLDRSMANDGAQQGRASPWEKGKHTWGWRGHREKMLEERRLAEAKASYRPAQDASAAPAAALGHTSPDVQSVKEAVEMLWNEKKAEAGETQKRVHDKAREYADESLEKLGIVLERLRESLREGDRKDGDKKLV